MTTKYYVDDNGKFLGGWIGEHEAPTGGVEVPYPPNDAQELWDGSEWQPKIKSYQEELSELNDAWQIKVEQYNKSFALAALSDGPSEESKKTAIRIAYEADKVQNNADRSALKVKHGLGGV
jgi:osmotically-inducible protein OsmY